MNRNKPTVGHFIRTYLFLTGSWIYTQLTNSQSYRPFVLTRVLENLDEFPFSSIYHYRPPFQGGRRWQAALSEAHEMFTHARESFYVRVIGEQQPRLLHAHFGHEAYDQLSVLRKVRLPLITTFYGRDVSMLPHDNPRWRRRYLRLFAAGTLFLAEGPCLAQAMRDLGCPAEKVRLHHLGVDVRRIEFACRTRNADEPVRLLMACSFREKKGIPYGVEAFARAVRKYPGMELRIVGGAKTPPERQLMEHCRDIAVREGVAHKVHFLGYTPYSEYLRELRSAHLFLAPSVRAHNGDTEGGAPVAVIEAAASGMPVIATRHCDIPNIVIDGQTGVLVAERDAVSLAEAILTVASEPSSWTSLGLAARTRVEAEFDACKQVRRLEEIYDGVASRPG